MRVSPLMRVTLAVAVALAVGGCDWIQKKAPPNEKRVAAIARARSKQLYNACASAMAFERLAKLTFDEAIRVRNADPVNLATLAAHTIVRMEVPVVKRRDDRLDVTVCSGRFIMELPPGAEKGFGGERRLIADVEYAAQPAADGNGLVYQLRGAEPIVYKLAAFDLRAEPYRSGAADDATRFVWVPNDEIRADAAGAFADAGPIEQAEEPVTGKRTQLAGLPPGQLVSELHQANLPVPPTRSSEEAKIAPVAKPAAVVKLAPAKAMPPLRRPTVVAKNSKEAGKVALPSKAKDLKLRQAAAAPSSRSKAERPGGKESKVRQVGVERTGKADRVRSARAETKKAPLKMAARQAAADTNSKKAKTASKVVRVREVKAEPKRKSLMRVASASPAKPSHARDDKGRTERLRAARDARAEPKRKASIREARPASKNEARVQQASLKVKSKSPARLAKAEPRKRIQQEKAKPPQQIRQAKVEPRSRSKPGSEARLASIRQVLAEPKPAATATRQKEERAQQANAVRKLPPQRALQAQAAPKPTPAVVRFQPSFNCSFARSRSEQMICANRQLAALDRSAASLFSSAVSDADRWARAELARTRNRFLAYRERCSSESCVANAYHGRMEEIRDIMAQGN